MKKVFFLVSILSGLMMSGCAKDADSSELGECVINSKKCTAEGAFVCPDGWWGEATKCEYGCDGDVCASKPAGSCQSDAKTYENNEAGYCVETVCVMGSDPVVTTSESVSCNSDNSKLGVCFNGAKKCDDTGSYICEEGAWSEPEECIIGCDGDVCKEIPEGACSETSKSYINNENGFCVETICEIGIAPVVTTSDSVSCNADASGLGECLNDAQKCAEEGTGIYNCLSGAWEQTPCGDGEKCQIVNTVEKCYAITDLDCPMNDGLITNGTNLCINNTYQSCIEGELALTICDGDTPLCDVTAEKGCRAYKACGDVAHNEYTCSSGGVRQKCNDGVLEDVVCEEDDCDMSPCLPPQDRVPGTCEAGSDISTCQVIDGHQWRVYCEDGVSVEKADEMGTVDCTAKNMVCVQTQADAYCDICSETDVTLCTEAIPENAKHVCGAEGWSAKCDWECVDGYTKNEAGDACIAVVAE